MMKRIKYLVGIVFLGFLMAGGIASYALAQEVSDMDAVRAANDAFYAALSARDTGAMVMIWSYKTQIRHIGPRNKSINVGLDAAMKHWEGLFAAFPEFRITCEEMHVRVNGPTAWVSVLEKAQWTDGSGNPQTATHFGTNIFEKQGGKWFMVYHHASVVPE